MILLVCGSRDWTDFLLLAKVLDKLTEGQQVEKVVHGAARGADRLAGLWADIRGIETSPWPAPWRSYPVNERWRAGHDRNQQMLDNEHPDLVVAFKDGFDWEMRRGGTEDMVKRAKKAEVSNVVVSHP